MESTGESSNTSTANDGAKTITRLDLFNEIKDVLTDIQKVYAKVENLYKDKYGSNHSLSNDHKQAISKLVHQFKTRWTACHRKQDAFEKNNHDWLKTSVELKKVEEKKGEEKTEKKPAALGRRKVDFTEGSDRTKRRMTEALRKEKSSEELVYAAKIKLRSEGNTDFAKVIDNISHGSPTKAAKVRKSLEFDDQNLPFDDDEALSLFVELDLSQSKYQQLRNALLEKKSKIIPSYKKIQSARRKCYPLAGTTNYTINKAEAKLQPLLNHTTERIVKLQLEVLKNLPEEMLKNLILYCKWGCDGSSGHSEYKQKRDENSSSDENIFFTSFVPLQLIYTDPVTQKKTIVWKNPRPSSTRFCRPIVIECAKESVDLTKETTDEIEKKIKNLVPFKTAINAKHVSIAYDFQLTMIDTKVCNSLTDTKSAQCCYVCKCKISEFNKIDEMLTKQISTEHLKFGLSTLHCWIRCFEYLLHVSYRLDIKKWRASSQDEKKSVASRKKTIQETFKEELGLNVDKPKSGSGTSNDGNTARVFFENYDKSAQILGIDEDIIHRFYIVLQTIASGHYIDVDKFRKYCLDLAKAVVEKYEWYYLPTLVHKLLIHGPEIIEQSLLPIGQMSEDAQEACNKYFKIYRLRFARKNHRQKTMEDVFKRFLIASDPYISSLRKLPAKPLKHLSQETINLLKSPSDNAGIVGELYSDSSADTDASTDAEEGESYDIGNGNFFL